MELTVKLQVFEGPLDLLLHLLEKNKVNIYDIPIVEITNQYMEYIAEMKRNDLNVMSEFLVMAATLIDIKSRMLLPKKESEEEEEEDPRAELVQQLLEYKMYKCMAYELRDRQMDAEQVFKTLVTRGDKTGILVFCIPVDMELDLKKAASVSKNKKVEMTHMKELLGLTGYIRGGCSPIGMKKKYPTFIDETCILFDEIAVSAGVRGEQVILNPQDLVQYIEATEADITKPME